MAERVIITAGSGMNVTAIDAIVNFVQTNDAVVNLEPNTYYDLAAPGTQDLNLPVATKPGDVIGISATDSGLFKIAQRAGEQILYGILETTLGTFGTFESTQPNTVLYLRRLTGPGLYVAYTTQGEMLVDSAGAALLNNSINNTSFVTPNSIDVFENKEFKNVSTTIQSSLTGGVKLLNPNLGAVVEQAISSATTINLSMLNGQDLVVYIDMTVVSIITWDVGITWSNGAAPPMPLIAKYTVVFFKYTTGIVGYYSA